MTEEFTASINEQGNLVVKNKKNISRGKKSRSKGSQFEARVRKDLEQKGWIVAKWPNNVDLEKNTIIPAKRRFNPFLKIFVIGTGFPDFICFKKMNQYYKIIGVEVKINGSLSKIEKQKCRWYLENQVFNEILIAKKTKVKNKIVIEYKQFQPK